MHLVLQGRSMRVSKQNEEVHTWTMPVVRLQARQYSCPFLRLATAMRPHFSHTCTRYASLWSNSRSCEVQAWAGCEHETTVCMRQVAE